MLKNRDLTVAILAVKNLKCGYFPVNFLGLNDFALVLNFTATDGEIDRMIYNPLSRNSR